MLGLNKFARRIFGSENERKLRSAWSIVEQINALEEEMQALSDDALREKTAAFRERLAKGESLDDLLPEAFATVREGSIRSIGLRHFDVQLVGGMILHQGKIAEMKTGEGKTLVATLPVYLNALEGQGAHVVTVNDYLAKRDAAWMGQVYGFLGMSVGVVVPGMDDAQRKEAYDCDITYATNNELGFDYLRDNMKYSLDSMAQRARHRFAIVDEVDSILVDEARTPLIISGPTEDQSELYVRLDTLVKNVEPEDYEHDEKQRSVAFTEEGAEKLEEAMREAGLLAPDATMYDPQNVGLVHHSNQALRAHVMFQKDKDYIVKDGEVIIIDEFTGRMKRGRRFSEGLHQALEAKEKVDIQPENVTLASVTFQNYFRLYDKLAGMTGTAMTEANEFAEIYKLDVIEVPTNKPITREDEDDLVFRTAEEKFDAIVEAIRDGHERAQPILVGTTSIEKSEQLSARLKKEKIPHNVLNARFHEQEAQIVAQAGRPGAVTIATNMAGRGTDIQLGGNLEMRLAERLEEKKIDPENAEAAAKIRAEVEAEIADAKGKALEAGGLWVISTERHESRRIDNQLRGRSGRQGDPGRSTFFLSLQDDLMRIFGSERMDGMLRRLGLQEGEAIVHPWVNKAIERSQAKVEARNFEIRKNLLKYDDVMNDQRRAIFEQRLEIMESEDVSEMVADMRHSVIEDLVARYMPERAYAEQWDVDGLGEAVEQMFGAPLPVKEKAGEEGVENETVVEWLADETDKLSAKKVVDLSRDMNSSVERARETMQDVEKAVVLQTIDHHWREHLSTLDQLRSVIGLRGYGQRDPLNEYKSEAFGLFETLLSRLRGDVVQQLMNVRFAAPPELEEPDFAETNVNVSLGGEPEKEPAEAAAGAAPGPGTKKKRGRTRRVGKGRR